jgi:hypothetical protein
MPLSQALAYNVEHLETAAEHWTKVADHRESTFADVRNRAHSIDWTGAGADGTSRRPYPVPMIYARPRVSPAAAPGTSTASTVDCSTTSRMSKTTAS